MSCLVKGKDTGVYGTNLQILITMKKSSLTGTHQNMDPRILLVIGLIAGCSEGVDFDQNGIDSFMNAALACRQDKNPGLTVSVVRDGKVMFAKGYGVTDVKTGRPVTNTTLFGLASMSKAFATTLMIKLLHDRNMSIYTKPADVLKEGYQYANPEFTQYATIRDLMTHCLGVPTNQGMRLDTNLTRKDAARRIRYFDPIYKFRLHYLYSNMHFGILTYLAEVIGGKPWEDLIEQYIYRPLGMTGSDFMIRVDRSAKDVAQGYADDEVNGGLVPVPEEVNRLWGVYAGSTGIMSSSNDITKWMLMQLNDGKDQNGHEVIRSSDLSQTHSPQTAIRSSSVEKMFHKPKAPFLVTETNYAMGWKNGIYKDWKLFRHTGTTYGYSSLVTLIPEVNLGIFTSMTGEDEGYVTRTLLHSYLIDTFLGETPTINKTTVCTYPEPWFSSTKTQVKPIVKTNSPSRPLSQYVGVYKHVAYGNLVISINTTVNKLQMDYGAGHWILYPDTTRDRFHGEAFGIMYKIYDLAGVQFHMHTKTPDTVDVTTFEPKAPPRFTKTAGSSHHAGSSIVG